MHVYVNASSKKEALGTYLTISCGQLREKRPFRFVCILLYAPCVHVYPFAFVAIAILVQLILTTSYICRKQAGHWYNK